MSVLTKFINACKDGEKEEARLLYEQDPAVINQSDTYDWDRTGLIASLSGEHFSITEWLLSLPGLDTNFYTQDWTALHIACLHHRSIAPLEIVKKLVELSSWDTINKRDDEGQTALDLDLGDDDGVTKNGEYLFCLGAEGSRVVTNNKTIQEFIDVCGKGDIKKAKSLYEHDHQIINKENYQIDASLCQHNWEYSSVTGLMQSFSEVKHSLARWLLERPELNTNFISHDGTTILQHACKMNDDDTPLDIIIQLTKLCSWETVNRKDRWGDTALDYAVIYRNTSAALYLSWLGAECKEENRNCCYTGERSSRVKHTFTAVTLQTWIETGCQQEAQYWAVVANDAQALNQLARMENITMDTENLKALAKQYNHQKIFSVWGELASLTILAWEVCVSSPALHRPGTAMPELNLASYRDTLHLLCRRAKSQNYNQEEQLLPYGENNSAM